MANLGHPNTVLFGYLEGVDHKDADAYARSFARRTLATAEHVWYHTESIYTGYLYEVHEGGTGRSFLPDIVTAFESDPTGTVMVPSGRRVFELTVRNGRPTGALLSEERSIKVLRQLAQALPTENTGGKPYGVMVPSSAPLDQVRVRPVRTTVKMKRLAPATSQITFLSISAVFTGLSLLVIGTASYFWTLRQTDFTRGIEFEHLAHRQWPSVLNAAVGTTFVTKLEFKDGRWAVDTAVETSPSGPAPETRPQSLTNN